MRIAVIGHNYVFAENRKRFVSLIKKHKVYLLTAQSWGENTANIKCQANKIKGLSMERGKTLFTGNVSLGFFCSGLFSFLRKNRAIDILDVHEEPWSLFLFQVLVFRKLLRIKAKVICYSAQNLYKRYPLLFRLFEKIAYANVCAIYCCNEEVKEVLVKKGYKKKVVNIPLGIDYKLFKFKKSKVVMPKKLLYVGRQWEPKGIFDLLSLMKKLPQDYQLTMIGGGPDLNKLKREIVKHRLSKRVKVFSSIDQKKLVSFYQKSDLLLVPSKTTKKWKEQFGRIIVEAFACGLPVIGSTSGSIPELVKKDGLIFSEGDMEELKNKVLKINLQSDVWQKRIKNGRKRVENYYSWQNVANLFDKLYKEVE